MLRKLFATTAMVAVMATGAYAQDASQTKTAPQAADTAQSGNQTAGATAGSQMQGDFLQKISADQYLASNLNGKSIYPSNDQNAEAIGEINNFLVGNDGTVVAAIVDVTGADQSKTVAVPFDKISWSMGEDQQPRAVMENGQQELQGAPAFTMPEEQQAAQNEANGAAGTGATTGMATTGATGTGAAGTGMAANDTGSAMTNGSGSAATGSGEMAADASKPAAGTASSGDMAANTGAQSASGMSGDYPTSRGDDQYLSQNIIGSNVYGGAGDDADDIGSISDLVIASSGKVDAAVVGVGGFLGIGEKDVGVPFDKLQFTRQDNEPRVIFASNRESLEQAPSFDDSREGDMAANTGAQSANEQTAAAGAATGAAAGAAAGAGSSMAANDGAAPASGDQTMAQNDTATGNQATGTMAAPAAGGTADTTTTASTGGDMRSQLQPVQDSGQLTADNLIGTSVYGPNDATVGDIGDVALNPDGQVDAIIVDVGGFLGIGEKPVAVAMDNLKFMQDSNGTLYLYTDFTQDQLENAPEYNADTYAQNRDSMRLENPSDVNSGQQGGNAGTTQTN